VDFDLRGHTERDSGDGDLNVGGLSRFGLFDYVGCSELFPGRRDRHVDLDVRLREFAGVFDLNGEGRVAAAADVVQARFRFERVAAHTYALERAAMIAGHGLAVLGGAGAVAGQARLGRRSFKPPDVRYKAGGGGASAMNPPGRERLLDQR